MAMVILLEQAELVFGQTLKRQLHVGLNHHKNGKSIFNLRVYSFAHLKIYLG